MYRLPIAQAQNWSKRLLGNHNAEVTSHGKRSYPVSSCVFSKPVVKRNVGNEKSQLKKKNKRQIFFGGGAQRDPDMS